MNANIEPRKVAGVILEANSALVNKGFNSAEILVGLSELIGRITVDMCTNSVGADALLEQCFKHMRDTARIGLQAQEKSLVLRA